MGAIWFIFQSCKCKYEKICIHRMYWKNKRKIDDCLSLRFVLIQEQNKTNKMLKTHDFHIQKIKELLEKQN